MALSKILRDKKLKDLADGEGLTLEELLERSASDSVSSGICIVSECDYTTEVEPDQREGWCENCNVGTVQSALVLFGLI